MYGDGDYYSDLKAENQQALQQTPSQVQRG